MRANNLRLAVAAVLACGIFPAQALELYVDQDTQQVFTAPGKNRVKLGNFEKTDETHPVPQVQKSDIKAVESKLTKKINTIANKPKEPGAAIAREDAKGIRFESNDGDFKFQLNGRLHTDGNFNSGGDLRVFDDENRNGRVDASEASSVEKERLTDGSEIRRFRMEFAARFFEHWGMKMQPEFSNSGGNGTVGLRDAYIQYDGFDWGEWTVGQSKQPYSLQQMMSSNDMVFMERSLEYEFTNRQVNRAVGLRYDTGGTWWGFATGLYGDTATRQSAGTTEGEDEGWGAAARITGAPLYEPGELIHVGVSAAHRAPREGDPTLRYRSAPSPVDHADYLDTGKLDNVHHSQFFNAEAAGVYGPLSIEGEYNATWISRSGGFSDGFLHGFHFDVAYSLTGESRASSYDAKQGVFKRLTPNRNFDLAGGWGAWELKARTMYVDMNDVGTPNQGGGRELATTMGFNWYWNPWARLLMDWTHVWDLDIGTAGVSRTLVPGPGNRPYGWDQVSARVSLAY